MEPSPTTSPATAVGAERSAGSGAVDGADRDAELRVTVLPGDRLIVGLWIAVGLAIVRAVLQGAVDATADGETGVLFAEHFVEHLVESTARAWWMVPPLAILPRGRHLPLIALRAVAALTLSVAFLAGWPEGEPRYTPGIDSVRGFQGWAAIGVIAAAAAALDRFATSPRRTIFRWSPVTRFVVTGCVLVLGGGALASVVTLLEQRRRYMEQTTIVVDLLDELPKAKLSAAASGALPVAGSLLAVKGEDVAGGNKPSLIVPVGGAVDFEIDLPRHASLLTSLGVDSLSIRQKSPPPQLLTFAIAVDGVEVQATSLRPQERADDRCWIESHIALTSKTERHARITLSLRGDGLDLDHVRAGFGRPLIVRRQWRPRVESSRERMNVVLVVVDSLRPDHLGCYGYAHDTSPAIDALAREGIVYEQARTPAVFAWPSIATLLTGLYPPTHGVDDVDRCFLSDSLETLPERLADRGCTTLGTTANPLITQTKNFDQGFADWREYPLNAAARLVDQFGDWVRRYEQWQFFAFVHLHDPYRPYNAPEAVATRFVPAADVAAMRRAVNEQRLLRSAPADPGRARAPIAAEADVSPKLAESSWVGLYDAEVRYVDDQIARLVRQLARQKLLDKTVIVVVGSHGERLGAGLARPAGSSLDLELRHVPLIIRDPRVAPSRVAGLVDQVGLASTLLELAGVAPKVGSAAAPALAPWGRGGAPSGEAFFHTARAIVPGAKTTLELIGIETADCCLEMQPDGTVVDFTDRCTPPRTPFERGERQRQLVLELGRWYARCREAAVARPFERVDYATRTALDQLAEPEPSR